MKKKLILVIVGIIIITAFLSGCITSTEVEDKNEKVFFTSDVTSLTNYTLSFTENNDGQIVKATVDGRVENKINRLINVKIVVEFYDNEDNYINNETYRIYGLRVKPNAGYTTTFTVTYSDINVDKISYTKIYANEIEI